MSILFSQFFAKFNKITPLENNFTEVLKSIAIMPKMLYFYGEMPQNMVVDGLSKRPKCVAIVGSRHNTRYGEEVAYKMTYELAKKGVIIISGLAFGIDSIAHRATLDAGGKTVAILGTAIDRIYPREHLGLAKEIVEKGGVVMSEYEQGLLTNTKYSFLERNRLIAGLADVIVVVEAAEKSGSLNTAMHAIEQGKELLAVPGNINNPLSAGCNKLIRQGANPYTGVEDVLDLIFPQIGQSKKRKRVIFGDNEEETKVIQLLAEGVRDGEEIIKRAKLRAEIFNQTITMLEIKGVVRSLGANQWTLK